MRPRTVVVDRDQAQTYVRQLVSAPTPVESVMRTSCARTRREILNDVSAHAGVECVDKSHRRNTEADGTHTL